MRGLSEKEIAIVLLLVKDFSTDYNANNITKEIAMTPAGAFKALQQLKAQQLVVGKKMGKAIFYKVRLEDPYVFKVMETLLMAEARTNVNRWREEFKDLFEHAIIVLLYGSVITVPKKAKDIDLLIISKEEENKNIEGTLKERRKFSLKPLHVIKSNFPDFQKNLKGKEKTLLSIIKQCKVLHGQDKLLEVIKHVTSQQ